MKGPLKTVPRLRRSSPLDGYPTPYGVGYVWRSALRALIQCPFLLVSFHLAAGKSNALHDKGAGDDSMKSRLS
jgi:hypothetical protein